MSRTYKDEPYWVRKHNKAKYDTYVRHDHSSFGREFSPRRIYKREIVADKTVSETVTKLVPVFASEYHKYDTEQLTLYLSAGGSDVLYYYEEERTVKRRYHKVVFAEILLETKNPDRCSLSLTGSSPARPGKNYWRLNICREEIVHWQLGKHEAFRNRPDKHSANLHHRSRRNRHAAEAKKLTKLYNSGEDLYSYDYETLPQRMHEGWWD